MTDATPTPIVKKSSGVSITAVLLGTTLLIVIAGAVGFALNRHITSKIAEKTRIADDGWINYRRKTNLRETCTSDVSNSAATRVESTDSSSVDPNFTPLEALVK